MTLTQTHWEAPLQIRHAYGRWAIYAGATRVSPRFRSRFAAELELEANPAFYRACERDAPRLWVVQVQGVVRACRTLGEAGRVLLAGMSILS